jgi:hypothetical protein
MISFNKWEVNFPPKKSMLPDPCMPRKRPGLSHGKWALLLYSGLSLASCSHKLAPEGHYQSAPVVADGVPNEWTLPLRFSDANYTLQYNVTNDNKNVYVCVISRNDQTMIHMLRAGITLYFDPKGDKSKDIALHFPLRKQPDPANFRNRNGGEPLTNSSDSGWRQELVRQSDDFGTAGFIGIENGQFAVGDQKCPIQVAIRLNNNDSILVYEAVIPIYNILGAELSSRNPKKTFSVGVVVNPPEAPGAGSSRPYGGGGRGMGLGVNGFNGGGHSRRPVYNNQPAKEEVNWYPFRLVKQ